MTVIYIKSEYSHPVRVKNDQVTAVIKPGWPERVLSVFLVIPADHALEQGSGFVSKCTGVEMDKKKQR